MKVLIAYNRYRQRVHGEEVVVRQTTELLHQKGIEVVSFVRTSEGLEDSPLSRIAAGIASFYNPFSRRQFATALRKEQPDVVHVHNIYPWLSPSILSAASAKGVPVVMTIHHYGLTCPVLTHFRAGSICTDCQTNGSIMAVKRNCRNSIFESGLYAARHALAQRLRLFRDHVSMYIALSEFAKAQLINAGFPDERIAVRPNMVFALPERAVRQPEGQFIGFVGRVVVPKGLATLCRATAQLGLPLKIAGEGEHLDELKRQYAGTADFVGILSGDALSSFYRGARLIVVPSRWWEVCPMVVLEAMNHGTPVVGADIGGIPELLDYGRCGLLFRSDNLPDLVEKIRLLWNDAALRRRIIAAARTHVTARYTETSYFPELIEIYAKAAEMGPAIPLGGRKETLASCSL
jgi:glycosyltransferase involved in cell wall biosynthesis